MHPTDHQTLRDSVRTHSALFLAQGIIMILLGVAAVIWPLISSVAIETYVGWLFLLSGIFSLALLFMAPSVSGFVWALFTGALALFTGVLLLWHPVAGVITLTLVLIAFFIAEGLFQIAAAIAARDAFRSSWGWMLFSGAVDLVLAGLIIAGWPGSAAWALGTVVGVNLATSGIAIATVAGTIRGVVGAAPKAA
ncbi:MAG: HdeD family acid-resistance protein [Alphaproteobacteria bacterium]|nr:HdeD family acid-resistance protein [Alphaproteobacteria bacterium]MBV9694893.1 HdeD family acid-resistance protein [Alphaproteobacteria bacterium]